MPPQSKAFDATGTDYNDSVIDFLALKVSADFLPKIKDKVAVEDIDHMMDISARSLHIKRDVISRLLDEGLYPYTKRYLGSFDNHFSTIGLVGMNEAGLNACWLKKKT